MTQVTYTERGFGVFCDFTDSYGQNVRVQESSNAEIQAVWIFCRPNKDAESGPSPHLTVEQAEQVRDALAEFIKRNTADQRIEETK